MSIDPTQPISPEQAAHARTQHFASIVRNRPGRYKHLNASRPERRVGLSIDEEAIPDVMVYEMWEHQQMDVHQISRKLGLSVVQIRAAIRRRERELRIGLY